MDTESWSLARSLYFEVESLPASARSEFLDRACVGNPALRLEVESLLAADPETFAVSEDTHPALPIEPYKGSLAAGVHLGPWCVVRAIGRGGMGEVYEAVRADGAFELRVAAKLLKRGLDTDAVVARFARERRILALLDHPNIARVLDAGATPDGRPFLVMEYVDGSPITEFVRSRELETSALLRLMITVSEAVQAAHAQQIVHRDLKPSNVLVTGQGQVKVLDFGIAKVLAEEDADTTRLAGDAIALTPAYAAPEQLLGRVVTPAADLYSLGVILYQLITEQMPHQRSGRSTQEIARELNRETVERPSLRLRRERGRLPELLRIKRMQKISGDLDLIVLKALHAEPGRRYRTAQALADDLRSLLDHRPVLARPDSVPYRVGRFVRRNRRALSQAALAGAAIAILAAAVFTEESRARYLRRLVELGSEQLQTRHLARAATYLSRAYSLGDHSVDVRFGLARAMPGLDALTSWSIGYPNAEYTQLAYTPDGKLLLVTDLGKGESFVSVWSVDERRLLVKLRGIPGYSVMTFGQRNDRVLIVGSTDFNGGKSLSQVWDLRSGNRLLEVEGRGGPGDPGPSPVFTAADPRLERIVALDSRGVAGVWSVRDGVRQMSLDAGVPAISVAFDHDGGRIVSGGRDGTVVVWDAVTGRRKTTIRAAPALATAAFFALDDKVVVTANDRGVLHLWNAESGAWLGSPGSADDRLLYAGLSSDGRRLVTLPAVQSAFKVWDLAAQRLLPRAHDSVGQYLDRFRNQPGGDGLLTPADDGVRVWSNDGAELVAVLESGQVDAESVTYSPDGRKILIGDKSELIREWNLDTLRAEPALLLPHGSKDTQDRFGTRWAGYVDSGRRIVSIGMDASIRIWNAADGRLLSTLLGHAGPIFTAATSPDGRRLVTGGYDRTARLWNLETGQAIRVLQGHNAKVRVAFSPAGDRIVTSGKLEPAAATRVWDAQTGDQLTQLRGDAGPFRSMSFSPDGRKLVTSHRDSAARVWDLATGRLLLTLSGHAGAVWSAEFSHDGSRILTASDDQSVRVWDASSGRSLSRLLNLGYEARNAIFSPDDGVVAIGGSTAVTLWHPATGATTVLPTGAAEFLAFNADGSLLAGGSTANVLSVWSVASGHRLAGWSDSRAPDYASLAFSADGRQLLAAGTSASSAGDAAYVWDVSLESRKPAQVAGIVACKSVWRVEGEKLVPQAPHPETCATGP